MTFLATFFLEGTWEQLCDWLKNQPGQELQEGDIPGLQIQWHGGAQRWMVLPMLDEPAITREQDLSAFADTRDA